MKNSVRQTIIYKFVCIIALLFVFCATTALVARAEDEPPYITVRFAPSPGSFEDDSHHIEMGSFGFRIESFPEPIAPRGYFFIGWYSDGILLEPPIANTRNTTLLAAYAPFQDPDRTSRYSIVYDPGLGQLPAGAASILALTYGSPILSLPIPYLEGYSFSGWVWDDENITAPIIVRGDMIIEAVWIPISSGQQPPAIQSIPFSIPENHFVIAFNPFPGLFARGETGLRFERNATTLRPITPEPPTRRGAVFTGWQLPCGRMLEPTIVIREDTMLTAIWDTNPIIETSPDPTTTEPRRNPQTSPLRISFAIFFATIMIGGGFYAILKLTGKQSAAKVKYNSAMKRYVREARMEIKNKRKERLDGGVDTTFADKEDSRNR